METHLSDSAANPPDRIDALHRAWQSRDPPAWKSQPSRFSAFARQALALGSPGLAFDILSEGLGAAPSDPGMAYLSALALAKGGSSAQAARALRSLLARQDLAVALRSDALSLAGRIAKDRWAKLAPGAERTRAGEQARASYRSAFELSRDPFPGINGATMSVLMDEPAEGQRIAREVLARCLESERAPGAAPDLWRCATLGEACLLLGEAQQAVQWYRKAAELGRGRHGDLASMRRQVKLLTPRIGGASDVLQLLAVPQVAIFTGHMLDAPGRDAPRFPARLEDAVAAAIGERIRENAVGVGYCSAACGADLLFIEQMLARGAEVNVLLPFAREDFVRASVAFAGPRWVERFDHALRRAASVTHCVDENHLGDDVLFAHAAELTQGFALLRAEQLETEAIMLAVADPRAAAKTGGTTRNLRRWQSHRRPVAIIDLGELRERAGAAATQASAPLAAAAPAATAATDDLPWGARQIKTMLFADMAGFSKLHEHQTPRFFKCFLDAVEKEVRAGAPPAFGNTWGDGLYLVFNEVEEAAEFALRLRDTVGAIDWARAGLPRTLGIRIGMHTGPVFRGRDPIIGHENYFGCHVTRAARIEPIAAPGSIYVSEQTAAALASRGHRAFACDYLGALNLAKDFDQSRTYRLRRSFESE